LKLTLQSLERDIYMELKKRKNSNITKGIVWTAAGVWAAGLLLLSSLPINVVVKLQNQVIAIAKQCVLFFADSLSSSAMDLLSVSIRVGMVMSGYAILAFLIWNALHFGGVTNRTAVIGGFTGSLVWSALNELYQEFVSSRLAQFGDVLTGCLSALISMVIVVLLRWLLVKYPRVFNREILSYVIFGVLTTIVNIAVYGICLQMFSIQYLVSNAIAWVVAVVFAYVVNKLFVFHSRSNSKRQMLHEFWLFIAARLFSFGVDELFMWICIDLLSVSDGISKVIVNVIVMIINYVFSKLFIFNRVQSADT
jgi:putative flippase GtrA